MWNKCKLSLQTLVLKGTLYGWVSHGTHWKLLKFWNCLLTLLYLLHVHIDTKVPVMFWCICFCYLIFFLKNLQVSYQCQGNPNSTRIASCQCGDTNRQCTPGLPRQSLFLWYPNNNFEDTYNVRVSSLNKNCDIFVSFVKHQVTVIFYWPCDEIRVQNEVCRNCKNQRYSLVKGD